VLHEFVSDNREEIIHRCRTKVLARSIPPPTLAELEYGVPTFLDQLVDALGAHPASPRGIDTTAARHGRDLQLQGFTVSQVVHDYGDVCQSITDLAIDIGASISADDFRVLNRCLDDAIASAVTAYSREYSESRQRDEEKREDERFGFIAHEMRNLVHAATLAFNVLQTGNVGVAGSTGMVLKRSLTGLRALVDRSVAEVRLRQSVQDPRPLLMANLIEDLTPAASLEAAARGLDLTVQAGAATGAVVRADRPIVAAIVVNLLQNAFKFTRPGTGVTLTVTASVDRVSVAVADECGGLPDDVEGLFRPFSQGNADRTGLGLGLAFSRWGAEVHNGRIHARSVPGHGCVFTLDLPRVPVPMLASATM
jgi:signal transduction histidine kinase